MTVLGGRRRAATRLRWAARRLELRSFGLVPEQFDLADGLRAALAVMVPLMIAVLSDRSALGWAVFAAFWTCLCNGPQSDRARRRLLGTFVVFGTAIAFLSSWIASFGTVAGLIVGPVFVVAAALLAPVLAGDRMLGTLLAVIAVVAVGFPHPPATAALQALTFCAGAAWSWLLLTVLWRTGPATHLRRASTAVLARLTDMADDLADLGDRAHPDERWHSDHGEHRRAVRLALERLATLLDGCADEPVEVTARARHLLSAAETVFSALIALDHAYLTHLAPPAERTAVARAFRDTLTAARRAVITRSDDDAVIRHESARLATVRRGLTDPVMIGCLRALEDAIGALSTTTPVDNPISRAAQPVARAALTSRGRRVQLIAEIRPAARQAIGVLAVYVVALVFHLGYPYWASMAVVVVLQGGVRTTWTRCLERILGSVLGGLIAFGLLHVVDDRSLLAPLAVLLATVAIALRTVNYAAFVLFLTSLFIVVTELLEPGSGITSARMIDNLIGSVVALLAVLLIWPDLGPPLHTLLDRGRTANLKYLDAVTGDADFADVRAARRAAGLASIAVETALHDLGGLLRGHRHLSEADTEAIAQLRNLAGEAAVAWHRRLGG